MTMRDDHSLLFVYGTLRPGLASGEAGGLVHDLESLGVASVEGVLYDVGEYPAMVVGHGVIRGELLRVPTARQLAALDAYEECGGPNPLFERVMTVAHRRQRGSVPAWVYVYVRDVAGAARIDHGDYLAHRNGGR